MSNNLSAFDSTIPPSAVNLVLYFDLAEENLFDYDAFEKLVQTVVTKKFPIFKDKLVRDFKTGRCQLFPANVSPPHDLTLLASGVSCVLNASRKERLDKLHCDDFSNEELPEGLMVPPWNPMGVNPCLSVSVTPFEGSVAICVSAHHNLVDAGGLALFLLVLSNEEDLVLYHSRDVFEKVKESIGDYEKESHVRITREIIKDYMPEFNLESVCEQTKKYHKLPDMSTKILSFSPSTHPLVSKVKEIEPDLSVNSILVALLWGSVCKARKLDPESLVSLGQAVDSRDPRCPMVPKTFTGNCSVFSHCSLKVADIIKGQSECTSLAFIARKILDSVKEVDLQFVAKRLLYMDSVTNQMELENPFLQSILGRNFAVSNWSKFPISKINFGFGEPFLMFPARAASMDGFAVIVQVFGTLRVILGLRSEQIEEIDSNLSIPGS